MLSACLGYADLILTISSVQRRIYIYIIIINLYINIIMYLYMHICRNMYIPMHTICMQLGKFSGQEECFLNEKPPSRMRHWESAKACDKGLRTALYGLI